MVFMTLLMMMLIMVMRRPGAPSPDAGRFIGRAWCVELSQLRCEELSPSWRAQPNLAAHKNGLTGERRDSSLARTGTINWQNLSRFHAFCNPKAAHLRTHSRFAGRARHVELNKSGVYN